MCVRVSVCVCVCAQAQKEGDGGKKVRVCFYVGAEVVGTLGGRLAECAGLQSGQVRGCELAGAVLASPR